MQGTKSKVSQRYRTQGQCHSNESTRTSGNIAKTLHRHGGEGGKAVHGGLGRLLAGNHQVGHAYLLAQEVLAWPCCEMGP